MTPSTRAVTRLTSAYVRDKGMRQLVATVHHGTIELRAKGLRSGYTLDLAALYGQAVRATAARVLAERKAARRRR